VLFLEPDPAIDAPQRRRLDVELLLALAAAALASLGAAAPHVRRTAGLAVREVSFLPAPGSNSTGSTIRAAETRIERAAASADARVEHERVSRRDDLLSAALAGAADVRIVVTDRRPDWTPSDV